MPPVNAAKMAKGEDMDGVISKAIEAIDAVQNQLEDLSDQASQEILKVEQKFNALRKPHYEKRAQVISQIPNFWATVFLNHPQLSAILCEDDEVALQSLSKVDVEEMEGDVKSGYKIAFHFNENPYFENAELTKEVNQADPEQSKATDIRWKQGKSIVKSVSGPAGKKRKEEQASFFSWFVKPTDEGYDEIGDAIKDEIWPNPLQFYLGEDEGDDEDEDGGEDEEAEEEGEEDDEDGEGAEEDDEDDEEEEAEEEEDD